MVEPGDAEPGDRVKVETEEKTYEGTLIPRPETVEGDNLILKLDSGYNIGIARDRIESTEVIEEYESSKAKEVEIEEDEDLPTVMILSAGGTISSKVDYETGGVTARISAEDFIRMEPRIRNFVNIKTKQVMQKLSENVTPSDWLRIGKEVKEALGEADGVVITHGTDTMHYTAAALSFLFKNLDKPVVLTGAQRSSDRGSSDAFMNLLCSVILATKDIAEVGICMHSSLSDNFCDFHYCTKVRKMHTSRRDAFKSIDEEPICSVWPEGKVEFKNDYTKRKDVSGEFTLQGGFNENVELVYAYPGMSSDVIDFLIEDGAEGIVVLGTALGHVPSQEDSLIPGIERAIDENIPVCIASQSVYGRTHPFVYSTARKLERKGAIYLEDILPEVAYVKLCWVLNEIEEKDMQEIENMMLDNLNGEITGRINPVSFIS